jgi:hypothetical protein
MCVLSGIGKGQGLPTKLVVLRNGRPIHSVLLTQAGPGNDATVSRPSATGCIAVAPTSGGAMLVKFNRAGVPSTLAVRAPSNGEQFNSVSCSSMRACELAGTNSSSGAIVAASWNGARLGAVHPVQIPNMSGEGNYLPQISCSGGWCEISDNLETFTGAQSNNYQGFLVTTHDGRPTGSHWVNGYQLIGVSCSTATVCHSILSNASNSSFLEPVTHRTVGPPEPINLTATALACHGQQCIVIADSNKIATFTSDTLRTLQTVPQVRDFLGVTAGPDAFFAAVGAAQRSGSQSPSNASSVLTTNFSPAQH